MRKLLLIVALLFVTALGGLLVAPWFVDWNRWKPEISERIAAATGRTVAIDGALSLALLPVPAVTAHGVRIGNAPGAAAPEMARVGAFELRLAVAPLLSGRFVATQLRLVEPVLEIERLANGPWNWEFAARDRQAQRGEAKPTRATVAIATLVVERGTIIWRAPERQERIEAIDAVASIDSVDGPFRARGSARWRKAKAAFETEIGRLGEPRLPARVVLEAEKAGRLEVALDLAGDAVSGQASLAGDDLGQLLAALGGASPWPSPHRYSLAGRLGGTTGSIRLDDVSLVLDDTRGTGAMRLDLSGVPLVEATLALGPIDLDRLSPGPKSASSSPSSIRLPEGIRVRLDAMADAVQWQGRLLRQARLEAALENGELRLGRLAGLLPGGADASLGGTLVIDNGTPRFTGSLELVTDNLRSLLDWGGVALPTLPNDRLRRASLLTRFIATPERLDVGSFDLAADSSRITGAATVLMRDRPAIAARLALDRLNLDAYAPESAASSSGPASWPAGVGLLAVDSNIDATIENLTVRGQAMAGLRFSALVQQGEVTIREASVRDFAGATVKLSGKTEQLGSPDIGVRTLLEAQGPALDRVLRVAAPGSAVAERPLGAFDLRVEAGGKLDRLSLDASLVAFGGTASAKGEVRLAAESDLTLVASHPSLGRLAALLGYRMRGDPGKGELRVHFAGTANRVVADTLALDAGALRLAGNASVDFSPSRPRLAGQFTFGELDVDTWLPARQSAAAAPLVQLAQAGGRPALPAAERWSREPIDLAWLNALDGEATVEGQRIDYAGWRLERPTTRIEIAQGTLSVRKLEGRVFDGNLSGEAAIDGAKRSVSAAATLRNADLGDVGFSGRVEGRADVDLRVASAGTSPWELVSRLGGTARFSSRDGALSGIDLKAVSDRLDNIDRLTDLVDLVRGAAGGETRYRSFAGSFRIESGIARSEDIRLEADAGEGSATATVDLPRWLLQSRTTLSLTEHPGAPPLTMLLEGPLDEPRRSFDTRALQQFLAERLGRELFRRLGR